MKKILVGVSDTERAPSVLRAAESMAQAMGAKLTVIRAVGIPAGMPAEAMTLEPAGIPAMLLEHARRELDALLARTTAPELLEASDVLLGTAWQVLCDAAGEHHADMLVIGTHGYTLLDHLLGTTAARVVNHAPCTVVVVRNGPAESPAASEAAA